MTTIYLNTPLNPKPELLSYGALPPYLARSYSYASPLVSAPAGSGSSVLPEQEAGHTLGPLDAVVDTFTRPEPADPGAWFLQSRGRSLARGIEGVLGAIYERERLKDQNLAGIDADMAEVKEKLARLSVWYLSQNPQVDRVRANMEREVLGLEREKRFEAVACWRDVVRLRAELYESLGHFEREEAKAALLGSPVHDGLP